MYQQTLNTKAAKLLEEFTTQNYGYSYFVTYKYTNGRIEDA